MTARPSDRKPAQTPVAVPASPELEAAFIGACLMVERWRDYPDLRRMVDERCFTSPLWAECWRQIAAAWDSAEVADPLTVAYRVAEARKGDQDRDLFDVLGTLNGPECWEWNALPRARVLRELAIRRDLIDFGSETTRNAYSEADLAGVLAYTSRMAEMMDDLDARAETGELAPVMVDVEAASEAGDIGWRTGIAAYDAWCQGLRPGEVHVIGGPSGIGKTWLLSQVANAAADLGLRVAFFSLEMTKNEVYVRLLAGRIGLIAYRLVGRGRTWSPDEWAAYRDAKSKLAGVNLRLYTDQRSVDQIGATVRQWRPDVVLVDYVQLLDWGAAKTEYEALTANANALQRLSKRAGCAMVLATQQSREAIRAGAGSAVQGGMGSGRIDQIADMWVLIQAGDSDGLIKLVNRKNRHGPTGQEAHVRLDAATGRLVPA